MCARACVRACVRVFTQIERAKAVARQDLTAVEAFAIDDAGIADPDDAISVTQGEGGELNVWVHIADVGAVVMPGSVLDEAARRRGARCGCVAGWLVAGWLCRCEAV